MTKINVITTVDHAQHLTLAHESLKRQTLVDWEWTIVPLGSALVPDAIAEDPLVIVGQAGFPANGLGLAAAKKAAFARGSADYMLDLDQSDSLATPDVLARMTDEIERGADVVYGDFQPRWSDTADFDPAQGWESYASVEGADPARVIRAFDPDASALHMGAFVPRHGLLWRRSSYVEAGGHDAAMGGESDFDLLCRAYIAGAALTHLPERTVVTRRRGYASENPGLAQHVSNTYVYSLIRAWSERAGLQMLDLGAAHNPAPGFTSVDLHDATINCDIRFGLPVPDSSVGCIRAQDFLEHMNRLSQRFDGLPLPRRAREPAGGPFTEEAHHPSHGPSREERPRHDLPESLTDGPRPGPGRPGLGDAPGERRAERLEDRCAH